MLEANPNLKGREVVEELRRRFPGQSINPNSAHVAFSTSRRKLGITGKSSKAVRRRRPRSTGAERTAAAVSSTTVNLSHLKAARKFIAEVGGARNAIVAVQQLESLQLE